MSNISPPKRRTLPWNPNLYYEQIKLAYEMASLGANANVLDKYFAVDKRLELAVNKELGRFRKGAGWMNSHVVHRVHANIIYRMYCTVFPENEDVTRDLTAKELLTISKTYLLLYDNQYADVNRIYYIFHYLTTSVFSKKICSNCGMDFIFHSERDYNLCPFCECDSALFKK